MQFKELKWKESKRNEFRADVSIKGLFGIRFQYYKDFCDKKYYYFYIINGKKFRENYNGFPCKNFEEGKAKCEEKYLEICNQIVSMLCDENMA